MKRAILTILFLFTCAFLRAQVNYVINGDMEKFSSCAYLWNKIYLADGWRNARDSVLNDAGLEYYNKCGNAFPDVTAHVPSNGSFYQFPHSGDGLAGAVFYYDKKPSTPAPPFPLPSNYRDYLQGHLLKQLTAGRRYCVTFYVNNAEAGGYAHNKIGAYLDNGAINKSTDTAGAEILTVVPQVYTADTIIDTLKWTKIQGSFIAKGDEDHITIGNFFPNSATDIIYTNYFNIFKGYSYYLIDDISVVESDLKAKAGPDTYVEQTKTVKIGPADDTTATAIDCKWFHKGMLIDSGAIISVDAGAVKGTIDTYVVVQTICGNITRDTVLVHTVGLGIHDPELQGQFSLYPNPSDGRITITAKFPHPGLILIITDLLGRAITTQPLIFTGNQSLISLSIPSGIYLLQIRDDDGNIFRERINIR